MKLNRTITKNYSTVDRKKEITQEDNAILFRVGPSNRIIENPSGRERQKTIFYTKKKTLCESTTKQQENSTTNLLKPPWVVVFSDAVTQPLFSDCYALWTTTGTYFFWPSGSGGGGKVRATLGPLSGTAAEVLHWAR